MAVLLFLFQSRGCELAWFMRWGAGAAEPTAAARRRARAPPPSYLGAPAAAYLD